MGTILIDSPSRELLAACLISESLIKKNERSGGNSIEMAHIFIDEMDNYFDVGVANLIKRANKDQHFIFTPSYNVSRTPAITFRSKLNNIPLIVYHSEQFFCSYYEEEKFSLSRFEEYNKNVDAHFVWGNYFKEKLLSRGIPEHKIFVVGNIKNEVALYLACKKESGKAKIAIKYDYLFISSFSLAEMTDEEFSSYRMQFQLPMWVDERDNAAKCREGMIDFIEILATKCPDRRILVRRHPGESPTGYLRLQRYNNIVFSDMGPFSTDALSSRLVLLQDSTSIFELETLGIDWISVDFHESSSLYLVEPKALFKRHSKDLVLQCLLSGNLQSVLGKNEIEKFNLDYFIGPNDKLISSRIADSISQVASRKRVNKLFLRDFFDFAILIIKSLVCAGLKFRSLAKIKFFKKIIARLERNREYRNLAEHHFSILDVMKATEQARTWKSL